MLGLKHTRKTMSGGLYFGPPGWAPNQWDTIDPPDANGAPATSTPQPTPTSATDLVHVLETATIGKTCPWLPSLRGQLLALGDKPARTIVANFLPAQPESALSHAISTSALDDALLALNTIRYCIKNKSTALVLDRHDRTNRKRWRRITRKSGVRVIPLLNVYPQGDPTVLIWSLLAKKLPVGALPTTLGVLMIDPVTLWALGRFLRTGIPYRDRPVQIFSADTAPKLVLASIGMPIDTLLERANLKFSDQQCIHNGMLTGQEIIPAHNVVQEDTEIISLRPFPATENPTPCIEGGWCVDHCPTALNPAKLYHLTTGLAALSTSEIREAQHCIDCGLCSYVCPTRLPLTQRIVELRALQLQKGA